MRAIDYLKMYEESKRKKRKIDDKIIELQSSIGGRNIADFSSVAKSNQIFSKTEHDALELSELIEQREACVSNCFRQMDFVDNFITDNLDDIDEWQEIDVLFYYFIGGYTLNEVADKLEQSEGHTRRIKRRAIDKLDAKINNGTIIVRDIE